MASSSSSFTSSSNFPVFKEITEILAQTPSESPEQLTQITESLLTYFYEEGPSSVALVFDQLIPSFIQAKLLDTWKSGDKPVHTLLAAYYMPTQTWGKLFDEIFTIINEVKKLKEEDTASIAATGLIHAVGIKFILEFSRRLLIKDITLTDATKMLVDPKEQAELINILSAVTAEEEFEQSKKLAYKLFVENVLVALHGRGYANYNFKGVDFSIYSDEEIVFNADSGINLVLARNSNNLKNYSAINFIETGLEGCNLSFCNFKHSDFSRAKTSPKTSFNSSTFDKTILTGFIFNDVNMWRRAKLKNAMLTSEQVRQVELMNNNEELTASMRSLSLSSSNRNITARLDRAASTLNHSFTQSALSSLSSTHRVSIQSRSLTSQYTPESNLSSLLYDSSSAHSSSSSSSSSSGRDSGISFYQSHSLSSHRRNFEDTSSDAAALREAIERSLNPDYDVRPAKKGF